MNAAILPPIGSKRLIISTVLFSFIPILAKLFGAGHMAQSMLMSMNIAVVMLGNMAVTTLVRRARSRTMIIFSFILLSGGVFIAAFAVSLPMVFIAQFCSGFAMGMLSPTLMGKSIEKVSNEERTIAMGLHQAVYAVGMFSGPWLSGLIGDAVGIQPMFAFTGLVCLVLGLLGSRKMI